MDPLAIAFLFAIAIFLALWGYLNYSREKNILDERIQGLEKDAGGLKSLIQDTEHEDALSAIDAKRKSSNTTKNVLFYSSILAFSFLWYATHPYAFPFKCIVVFAVASLLRALWRVHRLRAYRIRLEEDLPNAIDLLVVCSEAGMALNGALSRVANELKGSPISDELRYTFHEINVGLPMEEAFRNLGERSKVADLQALAMTIIQAEKMGMSLSETLRGHAKTLRETIRLRTREKIQKLPIKLLFPLVFLIMPATLMVLLAPAFMEIFRELSQQGW